MKNFLFPILVLLLVVYSCQKEPAILDAATQSDLGLASTDRGGGPHHCDSIHLDSLHLDSLDWHHQDSIWHNHLDSLLHHHLDSLTHHHLDSTGHIPHDSLDVPNGPHHGGPHHGGHHGGPHGGN